MPNAHGGNSCFVAMDLPWQRVIASAVLFFRFDACRAGVTGWGYTRTPRCTVAVNFEEFDLQLLETRGYQGTISPHSWSLGVIRANLRRSQSLDSPRLGPSRSLNAALLYLWGINTSCKNSRRLKICGNGASG